MLGAPKSQTAHSIGVFNGAANQVTLFSGQSNFEADDVFIDGAGIDFLFRRTYKSQGFLNGPLGVNWDHCYNLSLRELDAGQKLVRMTGNRSESEYAWHIQNNYWVPPAGDHSVIFDLNIPLPPGVLNRPLPPMIPVPRYLLRLPNGTVHVYCEDDATPNHYLMRWIIDKSGNSLEFLSRNKTKRT